MLQDLLHDIQLDYEARLCEASTPQDRIDGFRIKFHQCKVEDLRVHCARAAKMTRDVNQFAIKAHKRPVRRVQEVARELEQSGTLERMAMRRLVPPSLQQTFEQP